VGEEHPEALIVRTSLLYGGTRPGKHELAARDPSFTFYEDELRNPVLVGELADVLLELVDRDLTGVLHLAGADAVSRCEFARLLARRDVSCAPAPPGRPLDCRLDSSRARGLLRARLRGAREVLA
jgi:dTDP-4-dehydrorhamnose reductase